MNTINRRNFFGTLSGAGLAVALTPVARAAESSTRHSRQMTINLVCGAIGVSAGQREAIVLADRFGFESVEANAGYLAELTPNQLQELQAEMNERGLVFGASGLPVDFRRDEDRFRADLKNLPKLAAGLQRAGVDRVGTWISPSHPTLTYLKNLRQHAQRLREVATILKDHGQRLGLEYVGTHTLLVRNKFPFVHTFQETLDLIDEIGTGAVGFVLDSWHWWQAGDTLDEIRQLNENQVVAVDLNDAPAGIPKDQQMDNRRMLPAATGVIDVVAFLRALADIRYGGPVRAEPFNQELNAMSNEAACAATSAALKKAFGLAFGDR